MYHTKTIIKTYWPTLAAVAACAAALLVWVVYFSTAVRVKPMLEQPGVVPFYTTRPASPNPQFGVAVSNTLLHLNDDQLRRRLDDIAYLGADWIRLDFGWDDIQPQSKARFAWQAHDRIARAAAQHDLKVLGILTYTPAWARDQACQKYIATGQQMCPPRVPGDFAQFAAQTAGRYPTVAAWEIWNEPNTKGFWREVLPGGTVGPNAVAYGKLANLTAAAIKKTAPRATVITGGLAHIVAPADTSGMPTLGFLQAMLPLLDPSVIDAIGVHPYTTPALPVTPEAWNAYYSLDGGPSDSNAQAVLHAAGWNTQLFWATEFGATTTGVKEQAQTDLRSAGELQTYDHVSESLQADILQKAVIGWCRKAQVGPLFLYSDTDASLPQDGGMESGFGLRRQDGSFKPAYEAVRNAIRTAKATCR